MDFPAARFKHKKEFDMSGNMNRPPPGAKFKLVDQEGDLGPPRMGTPGGRRKDRLPPIKYSFETPPDPIPEKDIKETITAEVIVCGGGISGMSAALSAVESGAKVVLIEMMGNFVAHGGDIAAFDSKLQKKLGIKIDNEDFIRNFMQYSHNIPDQRLIRMWANGSGESMDWLMEMTHAAGCDEVFIGQYPLPPGWDNAKQYYPQYPATHKFGERQFVKALMDNAIKKGAVIKFKMRARQLIRKDISRVTGVIAQDWEGNYRRYSATKGIILCTGDYGHNAEMMAKYCPQNPKLLTRHMTATGDGQMMGLWVGAVIEPAPHALIMHQSPGPTGTNGFLQVNLLGLRFENEDVPGQSYANQVERQPFGNSWQVYDAKYKEQLPAMGIGHGNMYDPHGNPDEGFSMGPPPLTAGTLEELAEKMEIPQETFLATVRRYNELAHRGKDLDFGKRADRLFPLENPPFYAGPGPRGGFLAIMGGLNVNTKCQALDKDWQPIPGLYVAGNTMGNRFAVDYPTMVPGICNGMALYFGRVAGRNAAT
jgi:fumarate reductase flavoprotein subunit